MRTETLDHVRHIMCQDNACEQIVPSDLRELVGEIDRLRTVFRVNILRLAPETTHAEIDAILNSTT